MVLQVEYIKVEDLRCSGCVDTIKRRILQIHEVINVDVLTGKETVKITYEGDPKRDEFLKILDNLGFPESSTGSHERTKSHLKI